MHDPQRVRARLQSVDQTLARLRAERNRLLARATQADRKRDTRKKILIGGAIIAAVAHEGVPAIRNRDELIAWLDLHLRRAHDRAVFDLE